MVLAHNIDDGLRTHDIKITQDVTFESMLLTTATLQGLQKSGFYKPSPVQLHAIPLGKCGFDLLLEAKSGTGKTAVFSVIALEKLDLNKRLQVVILAPTREIASQICDVIRQIGVKFEGLNVEVVMGGLPVEEDVSKFKKNVHIVVGSPGRLRHLVQDKHIDVSSVRLLVLDEADKLMDKSFQADINYIFSSSPQQKQVILSSATYSENTKLFISKYVKSAQHVCPDSNCILLGIEQKLTTVKYNANIVRQTLNRFEKLLKILSLKPFKQCLIFCNYQARVTELYKLLMKYKWPVEQLYGQQEQTDRLGALKTLQDYKCRILIATDLAARGIDASNVDLVVNFEPPFEWQTYLHRIGRAGRFGSYGVSITILSEGKEETKFKDMLSLMKVPLNIDTFSTNDNVNLHLKPTNIPCNNSPIINTEVDIKYQELWNELTGKEHNVVEIENFETMCSSYDGTKETVAESFTDLLESYERKQLFTTTNEYQHLQIAPETVDKFSDTLRVLKIANEFKNEKIISLPIKGYGNVEKANSNIMNENNDEKYCERRMINKQCNSNSILKKTFNSNKGDSTEDVMKNHATLERDLNCADPRLETISLNKSILNSGLPSSFASSKDIKNVNKQQYLSSNKGKSKHHNDINNVNCIPKYFTQSRSTNESYKVEHGKSENQESHIIVEESDPEDSACFESENYMKWYKQLKFRVKQIEMALYIEELSLL